MLQRILKNYNMKRLDSSSMENLQGGTSTAGNISINFPLTGLLALLGLGSLGAALEAGVGISYSLDLPNLSSLTSGLPLGL